MLTAHLAPLNIGLAPLGAPAYLPQPTPNQLAMSIPIGATVIARGLVLNAAHAAPEGSILRVLPHAYAGVVFALGLLLSGMADPSKVLGFLKVADWRAIDPSLALIVLVAVVPNGVIYRSLIKETKSENEAKVDKKADKKADKKTPASASKPAPALASTPKPTLPWATWNVPTRSDIDARLLGGAAVFGVGWGLVGVCPGPAIVGLGATAARACMDGALNAGVLASATFVGSMLLGMFSAGLL
jgi:uncharacterized membrane protein YedE/YeeE